MNQTPFYEISIALQGRPRMFRLLVIVALHICALVLLQLAGDAFSKPQRQNSLMQAQKNPAFFFSAQADKSTLPR
jgi:hypothetical protein